MNKQYLLLLLLVIGLTAAGQPLRLKRADGLTVLPGCACRILRNTDKFKLIRSKPGIQFFNKGCSCRQGLHQLAHKSSKIYRLV